ncbi:glutamate racemase [Secundilactobacillus yichangensis]|uniref:glutamate racemase n=1 Tax=Secundilactobacillus yichangensis TaxID=2799580 RepID=UPI001943DA35|nr:glutamate racemase [Secundilactobacillus yichangensis]
MTSQPIGFLDSGVGGLTVVKEALKQLPNESIVFLGDQARLPYGPRPTEEVAHFVQQIAGFLLDQHIKALVLACNTATAAALPILQAKLSIPVVGVIDSGSQTAVRVSTGQHIGVIATEGTIKSHAYQRAISNLSPNASIEGLACPEFVTVVEADKYHDEQTNQLVADQLRYFKTHPVDTLILGCTHFPLLADSIQAAMGPDVTLVDSGVETVSVIKQLLSEQHLLNTDSEAEQPKFYTTGDIDGFTAIGKDWLQVPDLDVTHVPVEHLKQYGDLASKETSYEA